MHAGEFGLVYKAHLVKFTRPETPEIVAVKTLKG